MKALLAILLLLSPTFSQASNDPEILVTIKPLHSLVSGLLDGITKAELLLDNRQSPHDYQPRPSQVQLISRADVIVWAGPSLESFMRRYIKTNHHATVIQLNTVSHSKLHELSEDPHRWLDPVLAVEDLERISDRLVALYPQWKHKLSSNLDRLSIRLKRLEIDIKGILGESQVIPAMVYHDAWNHFLARFGLAIHGVVNPVAHQHSGVRHLHNITDTINSRQTRCLIAEPQFNTSMMDTLQKQHNMKVIMADPLGSSLPTGPDAYFNMMINNALAFNQCR